MKENYINFFQKWFPINKAKGLLAQLSFEEVFATGFLKKHEKKFFPGCWVVSPKSYDSNKYRYVVSVHEKLLDNYSARESIDSILGKNKENFFKVARFLHNASFGIIYAVPFTKTGKIDFSIIDLDDFSAISWDLYICENDSLKKIDPQKFFSNWRSGMKPRKPQKSQLWHNNQKIISDLEKISENKLEAFVLKEIFYTGFLKSVVKVSTDDPYDIDCFVLSSDNDIVFPIELKEKSPVYATYVKDGSVREHYFGIDTGRISSLERFCSPSDSNAFYVIREVDDSKERKFLNWKFITLSGIVMASSWNAIGGGTGMFGSNTSTVKLPYAEFGDLTESSFDDDHLKQISSRSKTVKRIADEYEHYRLQRETA